MFSSPRLVLNWQRWKDIFETGEDVEQTCAERKILGRDSDIVKEPGNCVPHNLFSNPFSQSKFRSGMGGLGKKAKMGPKPFKILNNPDRTQMNSWANADGTEAYFYRYSLRNRRRRGLDSTAARCAITAARSTSARRLPCQRY